MMGAALLYLVLGDLAEGLFLVAAAGVAMGLAIFQESRSERALAALRVLAQPHVRAFRNGVEQQLSAGDLVPGDGWPPTPCSCAATCSAWTSRP